MLEARNLKSGFKKLEQNDIDIVLYDVKLPDENDTDFLEKIKINFSLAKVILLIDFGKIADDIQSMKNDAFDYILKGDDNDKIIPLMYKALEKVHLQKKVKELEKRILDKYSFDKIMGKLKALKQLINLAKKITNTDFTVLLNVETEIRKELFARAIYINSNRSEKSFVALNCITFSK